MARFAAATHSPQPYFGGPVGPTVLLPHFSSREWQVASVGAEKSFCIAIQISCWEDNCCVTHRMEIQLGQEEPGKIQVK